MGSEYKDSEYSLIVVDTLVCIERIEGRPPFSPPSMLNDFPNSMFEKPKQKLLEAFSNAANELTLSSMDLEKAYLTDLLFAASDLFRGLPPSCAAYCHYGRELDGVLGIAESSAKNAPVSIFGPEKSKEERARINLEKEILSLFGASKSERLAVSRELVMNALNAAVFLTEERGAPAVSLGRKAGDDQRRLQNIADAMGRRYEEYGFKGPR